MNRCSWASFVALFLCSVVAFAQAPPANDNCIGAIVVGCPSVTAGTTVGATADIGVPAACAGPQVPGLSQDFTYTNSVWYKITASFNGTITADTLASASDSKVFVFSGSCGGLSCVTANDNISATAQSKVAWVATSGTDYFLMVGPTSAPGAFVLTISCASTPTNDSCGSATVLSPLESGSTAGTTIGATAPAYTSASAYPSCAGTGGIFDVWYQLRACATGSITLGTCGGYDTTLSVHANCPGLAGPSNEIACNDNGAGACGPGSQLTFATTAGTPYYIRVAGKLGASAGGNFVLTWTANGLPTWYQDADGDGYGNPAVSVQACAPPVGYVGNNLDCADTNAAIHPGAAEICDGIDNDCDSLTDDADPGVVGQSLWYQDADADSFGNLAVSLLRCFQPVGYVSNNLDCNDSNPSIRPGAVEVCDGADNNCNGLTDDADPGVVGQSIWYQDADGDSFGNPAVSLPRCFQPVGYVSNNLDCNDSNASIHPGAPELCNGVDDNCNGNIDEGCPVNSHCFTAFPLVGGPYSGNNSIGGNDITDLTCGAVVDSVWYSYQNPLTCPRYVTLSLCAADGGAATFDAALHVFSGTCGALTLVACNDNFCGNRPKLVVTIPGNTTYYVAVSAVAPGPGGPFTMDVSFNTASFTTIGPGCTQNGGAMPTLTIDDLPILGTQRTVTITGAAPNSTGFVFFSNGTNVFSSLAGGCPIYVEGGSTVLWRVIQTDATGTAVVVDTVPFDFSFHCRGINVQAVLFPSGGPPIYQVTSGLGLVLGV